MGNPRTCRPLVHPHHKLHETLGEANPRLIQREVFRNGSVAPSAAKRSHGAAKTGHQWWRLSTNNLRHIFGHLGCGNGPDRLLQNAISPVRLLTHSSGRSLLDAANAARPLPFEGHTGWSQEARVFTYLSTFSPAKNLLNGP